MISDVFVDEGSETYDPNTLNRLMKASGTIDVDALAEASDEEIREAGFRFLKQVQNQGYEQDRDWR